MLFYQWYLNKSSQRISIRAYIGLKNKWLFARHMLGEHTLCTKYTLLKEQTSPYSLHGRIKKPANTEKQNQALKIFKPIPPLQLLLQNLFVQELWLNCALERTNKSWILWLLSQAYNMLSILFLQEDIHTFYCFYKILK